MPDGRRSQHREWPGSLNEPGAPRSPSLAADWALREVSLCVGADRILKLFIPEGLGGGGLSVESGGGGGEGGVQLPGGGESQG